MPRFCRGASRPRAASRKRGHHRSAGSSTTRRRPGRRSTRRCCRCRGARGPVRSLSGQGLGWTLASTEPKQGAVGQLRWFAGSFHTGEIVSRVGLLCASQRSIAMPKACSRILRTPPEGLLTIGLQRNQPPASVLSWQPKQETPRPGTGLEALMTRRSQSATLSRSRFLVPVRAEKKLMRKLYALAAWTALLLGALAVSEIPVVAQTRTVRPILAFPEAGLDDPAAYQGYQTRFFRDTKGNVVQVYLDARSGRVVNLLPDAVNESVGFTVRDGAGKPIRLEWGSADAIVSQAGNRRTIEYQLVANAPQILIGWILLGSMRVERDLGYSGRHLELFDWPTFRLREQEELIANLDRLDPAERQRQLGFLNAGLTSDLRARLEPDLITTGVRDRRGVTASQTTLDGKTNLQLDLSPDPRDASILVTVPIVSVSYTH